MLADSTAPCYVSCTVTVPLTGAVAQIAAHDERTASSEPSFRAASTVGSDRAVLFATRNGGGIKPECPGYTTTFTDWVQFGFQDPARGATFRKTGTFTLRHRLSRDAASAASQSLQICFEAPYPFLHRPGFRVEKQGSSFVGVLPECQNLTQRHVPVGTETPCVSDRQVVRSGKGWVVRIRFRVPPSRQDPKALG
jgi:hypothetical protein